MKSIVIPEPGRVEIRELPMVQKKKGEAVLKLLYGGVCGSDHSEIARFGEQMCMRPIPVSLGMNFQRR